VVVGVALFVRLRARVPLPPSADVEPPLDEASASERALEPRWFYRPSGGVYLLKTAEQFAGITA
jgi:hypothetical protein